VIVLNSITIGLQSESELLGLRPWFFAMTENLFLVIYCGELGMRFYAQRLHCLQNGWVRFDLLLVGMGVLSSWVVDPIVASLGNDSDVKETLGPLMVLRVLRLFRLARAVRLLVQFKTLWMLVRGS
jgi:hypothetical protein